MPLKLLDRLWNHATATPQRAALVDVETRDTWTWRQLRNATCFVSQTLLADLPPQCTVLLCAENEPAYVAAFLGTLRAGLQAFCISPASAPAEIAALATASESRISLGREHLHAIRHARDQESKAAANIHPHTSALLLQSSGTTGPPKIVRRTGPSLDTLSDALCMATALNASDHVLAAAPLCHSYGLEHGLLAPVWAGCCTHICGHFDVASAIAHLDQSITVFPGVPFMFEALANGESHRSTLRLAYSAGGPLAAHAARGFVQRFGVPVGQVYGATEIGSVTFTNRPDSGVGRPMHGVAIDTNSESGEIAIRSPWMFERYLDDPPGPRTHPFPTGDLGCLDADGNLFITGRAKLVIDVGGRKVNPLEVESVLADHPRIAQCVVIPMAAPGTVTRLKALVIPRDASAPPELADLRRFVKERLAPYKVPRVFELRQDLPLSATGKIMRHLIEG